MYDPYGILFFNKVNIYFICFFIQFGQQWTLPSPFFGILKFNPVIVQESLILEILVKKFLFVVIYL